MANVVVEEQSLIDIANAIRNKNETSNTYKPSEMANAILDITTGGEVVEPVLQEKTITPTTSSQTITPDTNYDGLSKVTINGVTSAIDSDIKATNIRKGIDILGVTGTMEEYVEPKLQSKSATPSTSSQTITPDSSYDGLSSVSVGAVTSSIDSNITSSNIKSGVSILGVTGTLIENEDLSSELNTQRTLLTSQTSKLSDVVNALVGKATGGGSDSTNKIHTGGSIGFVEDSGSYIGFLSFDSTTEFKDGEICKINFADFMELMTSDELTTVSEDIVLRYNSMFDNYSASVDVDLSRFGYGVYNIGISILPSLGAAMLMYEPEDTSQEPLNIGIWLEQTGRVADL